MGLVLGLFDLNIIGYWDFGVGFPNSKVLPEQILGFSFWALYDDCFMIKGNDPNETYCLGDCKCHIGKHGKIFENTGLTIQDFFMCKSMIFSFLHYDVTSGYRS